MSATKNILREKYLPLFHSNCIIFIIPLSSSGPNNGLSCAMNTTSQLNIMENKIRILKYWVDPQQPAAS